MKTTQAVAKSFSRRQAVTLSAVGWSPQKVSEDPSFRRTHGPTPFADASVAPFEKSYSSQTLGNKRHTRSEKSTRDLDGQSSETVARGRQAQPESLRWILFSAAACIADCSVRECSWPMPDAAVASKHWLALAYPISDTSL